MANKRIVYGLNSVRMALKVNPDNIERLQVLPVRKNPRIQELLGMAKSHPSITVETITLEQMKHYGADINHQGVLAVLREIPSKPLNIKDFLDGLEDDAFLLILDQIQDPHNLGACMRTAEAAGVQAVIVAKNNGVGITPVVSKVASGAAETLPFFQVTNLASTIDDLKKRGIWVMGTAGDADKTIYDQDLCGPLAIVLGSEGDGLRRLTQEKCDVLLSIPMHGMVESLNVSVATGVVLYEAVRQRGAK
jgi:23S rRNA (guanosine2251-2'-O)-methyltransferase